MCYGTTETLSFLWKQTPPPSDLSSGRMAQMKFKLRTWRRTPSGVDKTAQSCRIGLNCNCTETVHKIVFQGTERLIDSGVEYYLKLSSQAKESTLILESLSVPISSLKFQHKRD
jgi:hypothetical protein